MIIFYELTFLIRYPSVQCPRDTITSNFPLYVVPPPPQNSPFTSRSGVEKTRLIHSNDHGTKKQPSEIFLNNSRFQASYHSLSTCWANIDSEGRWSSTVCEHICKLGTNRDAVHEPKLAKSFGVHQDDHQGYFWEGPENSDVSRMRNSHPNDSPVLSKMAFWDSEPYRQYLQPPRLQHLWNVLEMCTESVPLLSFTSFIPRCIV